MNTKCISYNVLHNDIVYEIGFKYNWYIHVCKNRYTINSTASQFISSTIKNEKEKTTIK